MATPRRMDLTYEQIDELLDRVKHNRLIEGDYDTIKAMADTIRFLTEAMEEKRHSIGRLLRLLFGPSTEKMKNLMPDEAEAKGKSEMDHGSPALQEPAPRKRKGHGRNGADAYRSAQDIFVPHPHLRPGDPCPVRGCRGKVYESLAPAVFVRIVGHPPFHAERYRLQRLRCNLCGEVFTADTPEGIGRRKYDERAAAMIAMQKYGFGVPFYRMEVFLDNLGLPLPASTQWGVVEELAELLRPVFQQLVGLAGRGRFIHNDDTAHRILSLPAPSQEDPQRRAVFTSALVSRVDDKTIALFVTGRQHAGEAMADLLKHRPKNLAPPVQMCDALSRNLPEGFHTILANCLVHARRQFVDVFSSFPEPCRHVIEILAQVYRNEEETKEMSSTRRLHHHRVHSKPLMDQLHRWLKQQLDEKHVEPNSGLGKAIKYMIRHWKPLTLFLRVPGAPLDNNIVERAIKFVILHRKNSLFFKTEHGAEVGDIFLSVFHTCRLANVNIFDYLVKLQMHTDEVKRNPADWLPWNYVDNLVPVKKN
jgi:transposase